MSAEFRSNKPAVKSQFYSNVEVCLTAIGLKQNENAAMEITRLDAVDTGRLRASNSYKVGDRHVVVGNTANYAIYVNNGTQRMSARPFLNNSVLNYTSQYKEIVSKLLGIGF